MARLNGQGRPAEAPPAPGTERNVPGPAKCDPFAANDKSATRLLTPEELSPERLFDNE